MKFLAVHPGPLMYTKIYLRLEPLGLEMVAQAVRLPSPPQVMEARRHRLRMQLPRECP